MIIESELEKLAYSKTETNIDTINKIREVELKFSIDLLDVNDDQYVFDATGHDVIDEDIMEVIKVMNEWVLCLPHKETIMDYAFIYLSEPGNIEEDLIEDWVEGDMTNLVSNHGLYGKDLELMEELLEQTLRDFYNYTLHVLSMTKLFEPDLWKYFKCLSCKIGEKKLYLTIGLYEEDLRLLAYEEPNKCMVVLDDITAAIDKYERNLMYKSLLH